HPVLAEDQQIRRQILRSIEETAAVPFYGLRIVGGSANVDVDGEDDKSFIKTLNARICSTVEPLGIQCDLDYNKALQKDVPILLVFVYIKKRVTNYDYSVTTILNRKVQLADFPFVVFQATIWRPIEIFGSASDLPSTKFQAQLSVQRHIDELAKYW